MYKVYKKLTDFSFVSILDPDRAGALGSGEFKVVKRDAVKEYWFRKKILFSSFGFSTEGGEEFVFTNTQGSMKSLFEWAMAQPVPSGV